jgi:hypothetical protein
VMVNRTGLSVPRVSRVGEHWHRLHRPNRA